MPIACTGTEGTRSFRTQSPKGNPNRPHRDPGSREEENFDCKGFPPPANEHRRRSGRTALLHHAGEAGWKKAQNDKERGKRALRQGRQAGKRPTRVIRQERDPKQAEEKLSRDIFLRPRISRLRV